MKFRQLIKIDKGQTFLMIRGLFKGEKWQIRDRTCDGKGWMITIMRGDGCVEKGWEKEKYILKNGKLLK